MTQDRKLDTQVLELSKVSRRTMPSSLTRTPSQDVTRPLVKTFGQHLGRRGSEGK